MGVYNMCVPMYMHVYDVYSGVHRYSHFNNKFIECYYTLGLFQKGGEEGTFNYRISPCISRGIYPRTKDYIDNSSYARVTPSWKKLYRKQVEF